MEKCRIDVTLHFPITNAEYSLGFERRYATAHIVPSDASANTWSSHLPLAVLKYLLSVIVSATSGSCAFRFRYFSFSLGSTELSQWRPFLVQMVFKSRLIWTLNGANSPRVSNTEETRVKIFLWVIGFSTSLLVPLHTYRLSSVIVHWSPSTVEPSLLCSTSTCFVSLIDGQVLWDGVGNHVAVGDPVLQFKSMFWEKRLQLFENLDCFFRHFDWLDEIVPVKVVLDRFFCHWELIFIIDRYSLQSIVGTFWWTLCSENITLILLMFVHFWSQ